MAETDPNTPPTPEPTPPADPSFQPITLKVDGKDVTVTSRDQLIQLASKGADYTKKTQTLAEERKRLAQAETLHAAFSKYRESQDPADLRAFYEAGGYSTNEIEEMMALVTDDDTPAPNTPNAPKGGGGSDEVIESLKAQVQRLTDLVAGREGLTLDRVTENLLQSDPKVEEALKGLDETTASSRRSWLLDQATEAARRYIREGQAKGKAYSPTEERTIAQAAVKHTVELIERLGLNKSVPTVGPTPAIVQGDPSTPMAEPRLPSGDIGKLSTKQVAEWMSKFMGKQIHDARLQREV